MRTTQNEGKLPYDRIWPSQVIGGEAISRATRAETVLAQRSWDPPLTMEAFAAFGPRSDDCLRRTKSEFLVSLLAANGERQICIYGATDAETVRAVNREIEAPFDRAWSASVHTP